MKISIKTVGARDKVAFAVRSRETRFFSRFLIPSLDHLKGQRAPFIRHSELDVFGEWSVATGRRLLSTQATRRRWRHLIGRIVDNFIGLIVFLLVLFWTAEKRLTGK
jgi:hypothetical protein